LAPDWLQTPLSQIASCRTSFRSSNHSSINLAQQGS
jgi:hypothetical protein